MFTLSSSQTTRPKSCKPKPNIIDLAEYTEWFIHYLLSVMLGTKPQVARFRQLHPELRDSLQEFKLHLLETDEVAPLKVWQLQDLSFQAGQRVVSAPTNQALQTLQDISQNFPLMARCALLWAVSGGRDWLLKRLFRGRFRSGCANYVFTWTVTSSAWTYIIF